MSRYIRKVLKIAGWIALSFFSLVLLITLVFYLGRGWIMNRAVTYLNEQQPGEVQMGMMNLIPFMSFPDVSLQIRSVSYYEKEVKIDSLYQEPILSLNEIYVTLDVVDLIRGEIKVSETRLEDGFIRMVIYEDSITNLERALGIKFGEETEEEIAEKESALRVNLEKIELINILTLMQDKTRDDHVSLLVNRLESRFSYLPQNVEADVKLDIDVNNVKYLTYSEKTKRNIQFESGIILNPELKMIDVKPSRIRISGLELETWGTYDYSGKPNMDFAFRASNKELEVLNYLFMGILDLDEIEQIGSGSIYLSGDIQGEIGEQLPVVRLNGTADRIGFRIKSIQKDVTNISFSAFASNGNSLDLSEAFLIVDGFTATFPEGVINANISVNNAISPELNIEVDGELDLEGLEAMLETEVLSDLSGSVTLDGHVMGVVNYEAGEFLDDQISFLAAFQDVGFVVNSDSLTLDSVKGINGEVFMEENIISSRDLKLEFNGNQIELDLRIENMLHYMLGFDRDVFAGLSFASEAIDPLTLIRDTSVAGILGDELRGLHFSAGAMIKKQELDAFLEEDTIPRVMLTLDSFGVELPLFADIKDLDASLFFGPDTLSLHHLNGAIGESKFNFSGQVANYGAIGVEDSSASVSLEFDISSDLMRAKDFFTFNNEFKLPETYSTENLENFQLSGSVELPVAGLLDDSASLDFTLEILDAGWNFRYYPLTFEQFLVNIRRKGDQLFIDNFQGKVGESNLKMTASIGNFTDTLIENLYGSLVLESDLLDFNELLNYQLPEELKETSGLEGSGLDSTEVREPPRLDQIQYPQFDFTVDIGELRYGDYKIFGMNGRLRSTKDKILYLDHLVTSGESGGSMEFDGQFNVSNPWYYTFSAELDLEDVNINDLNLEMQMGEEIYVLRDNFDGHVSATGLAEVFITPDLKVDMPNTTAIFNVTVKDGALINFTPLQAAAKYLDNKDLDFVKFATLRNSFTLLDSRIIIPVMNVESTVGQLIIEGEQGLDNSYLYLVRVPPRQAMKAAKSAMSNAEQEKEEGEIQKMKRGQFLQITVWSDGVESDFKLGDRRKKFQE